MKTQQIKIICIAFLSAIFLNINAQENKQSAFSCNYNYQIPIGDLANTFGNSSAIGASYFLEISNNVIFGVEGNYIFGTDIKDSTIFENISTSIGAIIGADGHYANVNLMQRGFDTYLFAGYANHFSENNLTGIYISQGIGYLQHQIFIDTKNQNIPQLNEDMKTGYDRFSNGFSTKFSIDYKYYHKKGRIQMSSGFNYTMAYVKNQRIYNFAHNEYYSNKRTWDQLLGFKVEIIIPIHRRNKEEFHYY
ncbi:MAG: hypothetical protein VX762_03175 [Bacteroidota bacterium]|nr:hypothetical protein [Bacteroidota bacterium]